MVIVDDIDQLSPEWLEIKAGVPSASDFSRIVKSNGDPSKSRQDYLYELAGERIIGTKEATYQSFAMEQGILRESEARETYEFITGESVRQVAFVFKDEDRSVGCSPDGLMDGSVLEIKAPMLKTHVKYMMNGGLPTEYFIQVQSQLWVCNFHRAVFMSYYPGITPFVHEVEKDYKFCLALEIEMTAFLQELDETYENLRRNHG